MTITKEQAAYALRLAEMRAGGKEVDVFSNMCGLYDIGWCDGTDEGLFDEGKRSPFKLNDDQVILALCMVHAIGSNP